MAGARVRRVRTRAAEEMERWKERLGGRGGEKVCLYRQRAVQDHGSSKGGTYIFIENLFPPLSPRPFLTSPHRAPRFLDRLGQKLQLARDEGTVVRVSGPGADVDDVEGMVEEGEEGGELR